MCSRTLSLLAIGFFTSVATASSLTSTDSNFEFPFQEGNYFNASANAAYGYNDNFLNEKQEAKGTAITELSTDIFVQIHNDDHLFQTKGSAERFQFEKFGEDDHTSVNLKAKYFFKVSDHHTFSGSALFSDGYEYRGTGSTKGQGALIEGGRKYDDTLLNLGYRYGRFNSVSKVFLLIGQKEREYQGDSLEVKSLNSESSFTYIGMDYLISGKTYLSTNIEYETIDYQLSPEQNRDQLALLLGIKWEPSEQSQFVALLGYETLKFQQEVFDDETLFKWRISYNWSPFEHLNININSYRASKTSTEVVSNYNLIDIYSISGKYELSTALSLDVNIQYNDQETTFIDSTIDEQYVSVSTQLNYDMSHRFNLYLSYQLTSVESDTVVNEYDKGQLILGIKGNF